ncbi:hypothetical protein D0B54_17875 [Solimonas sp. K1W22B-7]|uniref:zeta toxin family protein n=1 Tax=Solimonas sp. K1W22B-7 TaxID=2303331 RepID=UPI000E33345D|nr:zeta toxin family protein [Solimonas sp. K1W22B-7]AXQ30429.1 hypothetical protein D0B54_17875 [Solimonas sp. K1W22B-7]
MLGIWPSGHSIDHPGIQKGMTKNTEAEADTDFAGDGMAVPTGPAAELEAHVLSHLPDFLERYRRKAFDYVGNSNYFSADIAKELFPEYAENREARMANSSLVQAASIRIKEEAFRRLCEQAPDGETDRVVFMAGGTGAGKSTLSPRTGVVYDGNLASIRGARRKIDTVLKTGRKVLVAYVYREPLQAYRDGVLPRAQRYGRIVPTDVHASTHVGAFTAFKALKRYFKNDDRVQVIGQAPEGSPPQAAQLCGELDELVREQLRMGKISELLASYALKRGR